MSSHFPQELIAKFLEEIGPDPNTLRSCALVCRAFAASSQRSIFSEVTIVITPETLTAAERLLDVLLQSPHLATQPFDQPIIWSPATASILGLLHRVKSFTLDLLGRRTKPEWGGVPKKLKVAIRGLCHQSPLESLHLIGLGLVPDPAEFSQLVTSSALKELSFVGVTIPRLSEHRPETKCLTKCRLELGSSPLDFVAIWGDSLSTVRSLHFLWGQDTGSHLGLQMLLNAVSPSLEDLHLEYDTQFSLRKSHTVSLTDSTKLRRLELHVNISGQPANVHLYNFVRALTELLEASCSASLSTLVISMTLGFFIHEAVTQPIRPWPLLDGLLSGPRFLALGNVELRVKLSYPPRGAQLFEILRAQLPRTRARGIFQCNEV
ncbi:hypothetical protein B0H16DRAFT_1588679 [Mycena metata]|uniref:Uncharacterized protein n=1 Tax=Mycena metata TaxID=1033252 RepID=A0AAD7HUP2_9AGAR|nr:hypothetical protein B0H16DRAFT_1588679 [Mycena metata]